MADLPEDRLEVAPPFSNVGVDVFGPWTVVTRRTRGGQANSKRWAVLFTCLVTRVVHIELVEEMSSSAFINALRRFTAIRGEVKIFRSDRGTNFVGAVNDLRIEAIEAIKVEQGPVHHYLRQSNAVSVFNPPHSSHMGGVWERMIGVSRKILDSMLSNNNDKNTFMAEVCAIINSRPLLPVSNDPEAPLILIPTMLLTQKVDYVFSSDKLGEFSQKDMYLAEWRRVQALAKTFWARWRNEYLPLLQSRQKWTTPRRELKEGDVILMRDKEAHRNNWPLGIVVRTFPGLDDHVRKVEVRIVSDKKLTVLTRPISELVYLTDGEL